MAEPTMDPTFYRTAADAAAAPEEQLAYVAAFDREARQHDAMTVIGEDGGLTLDERFFPHGDELRGLRVHQVRLQGGDASSDSYCYSS